MSAMASGCSPLHALGGSAAVMGAEFFAGGRSGGLFRRHRKNRWEDKLDVWRTKHRFARYNLKSLLCLHLTGITILPSYSYHANFTIGGGSAMLAAVLVTGTAQAEAKKKVLTTFTILRDMAQNVAGNAAVVESITKPGAEIHGYEPTPQDIVKTQKADLVLWNGMNLERWFEKFLKG